MHRRICMHLKDLIVKIHLNALLFESFLQHKIILPFQRHVPIICIRPFLLFAIIHIALSLLKVNSIYPRHILILLIQAIPNMQKQRLILKQFIVKMHRIHLQIFELILNRKHLYILCVVIIFELLIRVERVLKDGFELMSLESHDLTVVVFQQCHVVCL